MSGRTIRIPQKSGRGTYRKRVYAEFYWGLVLPVVSSSALFALLRRSPAVQDLEWWGAVFFIIYFSIQHTRRKPLLGYGPGVFAIDAVGVGVFLAVMKAIGLFDHERCLKDHPTLLFASMLSVPILGGISRCLSGKRPRIALSTAAIMAASLGLLGSCCGWPSIFGGWMMVILIVVAVAYFVGNLLEDGGRTTVNANWLQ